ncbi:hypothetical protein F8388_027179 [Cannabis sativa]|uniref:Uncharacterized protein n=1 Tax=Cannabis sativa TaxID=3483 RepID=A0A7J6HWB5_CANSA|nr:hypothetical protein F8388_004216 [Cannabis sativa]KAF4372506.1 hypothetical protein F8388_027179 [Cannabis sativa]KAF4399617.1 hypothetical protein G4B88_022700 [Cannabis sativa]
MATSLISSLSTPSSSPRYLAPTIFRAAEVGARAAEDAEKRKTPLKFFVDGGFLNSWLQEG